MTDIVYATGAVHDISGPVTSFAASTDLGREWIEAYGIDGSYIIETHMADHTIACIESDGLSVSAA